MFVLSLSHSLDFQSIELRILAHFSQDELLLKIFCDEDQSDIFVQIACQWMGLSADEVTDEKREKTKRIVYSVVYGAGSEKIAETLGVTQEKARAFTKSFLDKFPGIKLFTQTCISQCRKQGFVTSLLQRRRIIKNTCSGNIQQRLHAERQAVNFVIQGNMITLL
ncbi:DNA polymerase nu [Holothuria leucospilota]|uniref:DNA polymerase nu n=1 Tax=Holothuria leucospilota TaxID=206669 RepID=A0A9Q0YPP9_HOLLE|nr:DNA polymerase nu [Holothuria leucospilota]